MASQLEHYGDEGLKQWHVHLQNQLSEASHAHHQARDWLKQVRQIKVASLNFLHNDCITDLVPVPLDQSHALKRTAMNNGHQSWSV